MYQYQVSFGEAVKRAFSQYCKFTGRASRSEFWWFYLFQLITNYAIIFLIAYLLVPGFYLMNPYILDAPMAIVGWLIFYGWDLFLLLPSLGLTVRRLHDTGHSAWNLLWVLLPLIGTIILLVYFCSRSQPFDNKYGRVPNLRPMPGNPNGMPPYDNSSFNNF